MEAVKTINFIISIVFIVCYTYQFVYILVPFVVKDKRKGEAVSHRYAVLVSARNEEAVIGNLIESIKRQTYDGGLVTHLRRGRQLHGRHGARRRPTPGP